MKRFKDLVNEVLPHIRELFPWDVEEQRAGPDDMLVVDIREPYEYQSARIEGSINVPRGILESACDWGYEETVPELVSARNRPVLLVCRSGNRSALAAAVMQEMGFKEVSSLKTGLAGWNDYELPLVDADDNPVDIEEADEYFATRVAPEQMPPERRAG